MDSISYNFFLREIVLHKKIAYVVYLQHYPKSNKWDLIKICKFLWTRNGFFFHMTKWKFCFRSSFLMMIEMSGNYYDNGKSHLNFDESGALYFINQTYEHGNNGQKLIVQFLNLRSLFSMLKKISNKTINIYCDFF